MLRFHQYFTQCRTQYQQFQNAEVIGLTPRLNLFSRAGIASMYFTCIHLSSIEA